MKNNILVGGPEGVLLKVNQIGTAHLDSDYNAMWIASDGAFAEWGCVRDKSLGSSSRSLVGVKHRTFAAYRTATGLDEHSLHVEPDFVNAAEHDFTLKRGSPLLGRGTDVGVPFSGNEPSIGAKPF